MIKCVGGEAGGHAGGEFHQISGFINSIEQVLIQGWIGKCLSEKFNGNGGPNLG